MYDLPTSFKVTLPTNDFTRRANSLDPPPTNLASIIGVEIDGEAFIISFQKMRSGDIFILLCNV